MAIKPPKLTRDGAPQNERERKAKFDKTRPRSNLRGYDADWQRMRAKYLYAFPQCSTPGCYAKATELHHVKRVTDRPDLRLDPRNLIALCRRHHSQITALEDGFASTKWGQN